MPDKEEKTVCHEYGNCPGIEIVKGLISNLTISISDIHERFNDLHGGFNDTRKELVRHEEKADRKNSRQFLITSFILTTLIGLFGLNSVELRAQRKVQMKQNSEIVSAINSTKILLFKIEGVKKTVKFNHDFYVEELEKIKKYVRYNAMAVGTRIGPTDL